MEAEQNGATSFDTAVKRKASYHYQGQAAHLRFAKYHCTETQD